MSRLNDTLRARFFAGYVVAICILAAPALQPAAAEVNRAFDGATAWKPVSNSMARLVADRVGGRGYIMVEIDMPPGWHTYWRHPGASGIAPSFDFSNSYNLKVGPPIFPAPHFFDDGVGGFNGYENSAGIIFPYTLDPGAAIVGISVQLDFGVCREICIPITTNLSAVASVAKLETGKHEEVIKTYLDRRPMAPSKELRIASASYDGDVLQFVVTGQELETPQLMLVPNADNVIGTQRIVGRSAQGFLVEFPAWTVIDKPFPGQRLDVLVRSGTRAILQNIEIIDHKTLANQKMENNHEN